MSEVYKADVVIVGGGFAGLSTAFDLMDSDKSILILERDNPENLGGLAKESFGGVMAVGTPLQKKSGIKDSADLAYQDWLSYAEFDEADVLPQQWAQLYVNRSTEMIYNWLTEKKISFLPMVNWPERGFIRRGNAVPRWHIAWGTGHAIIESLLNVIDSHPKRNNLNILYRHKVNSIELANGKIAAVSGINEEGSVNFQAESECVVVAAGGICGGDLSRVKQNWSSEFGTPPENLLNGSHRYADGMMHDAVARIGGRLTHLDKQWHYAAGIAHPDKIKEAYGLSLVPPRGALWVNALGKRIGPAPLIGATDTRYLVERICNQPGQYSWQIMNWKIAIKELAVSGCEYMEAFRNRQKLRMVLELVFGNRRLVRRLIDESEDFVVADSLTELVKKMNALTMGDYQVDEQSLKSEIAGYDSMIERGRPYFNDEQLRRIADFRTYRGDRIRMCKFQKILDKKALPLIAIREKILSRKSLGGIQTDLRCRVLDNTGNPIQGLYAIGEAAGFGGGGIHGKRSLEGTFLGSCVLTGRVAAADIQGRTL